MKSVHNPDHSTVQSSQFGYLARLALRLKPEAVFLCFSLVLGFSLLVIVPPFQAPDDQHHFFRAYQVSEGIMAGEHFRVEYLPKSLKYVWQTTSRDIPCNLDRRIAPASIMSAFQVPLEPDDRSFITSHALAYSPHYYFPQALGLIAGRKLGLGPLALHYVGRLFTLLFCIGLFYWSIKKTPVLKWVFCLLAATPTNISLAASCSQDAIISGLAFLFTAAVLELALSPEKDFTASSVLFPAIIGALLAPAKAGAYAPMLAFFLFIPVRKAGSLPRYLGLLALGTIPALVTFAWWTMASQPQLLPIFDQLSGPRAKLLLWGIWEDPLQFFWLLGRTTIEMYRGYVAQFVGVLGWADIILPRWIIITDLALFLTGAILDNHAKSTVSIPRKVLVGLVVIIVYSGIQATQYCTYSPQHSPVIVGFLGRYLIPLGPAFFLLFSNCRQIFTSRFISFFPVVVVVFMLAVIPSTLLTVVNRYYGKEQATWRMSLDLRGVFDTKYHVKLTSPDDFYQTFVSPLDGLCGVTVPLVNAGVARDKMITGHRLILKDAVSDRVVREVGIQPFLLKNQDYLDILFDPILDSKNKKYKLTIFPTEAAVEMPISIPLTQERLYPEGETVIHGRKTDRSVVFELIFKSSVAPAD